MDLPNQLAEIAKLSVEERIQLVQAIWDTIPEDALPPLSDAMKAELDARIAEMAANPDDEFSWDEVVTHVRGNQ
jgi:putative addiction module component (TIGR02574 family)